ncbi:MAG: hypothetical protein J5I94_24165, partial [Phaeodactylibacter sp.]|nr:hypothetical protein [Phaeodactylibacter sp.]
MKKAFRISAYVFGAAALFLAAAAAYIQFIPAPSYGEQQIPDISVEVTPARVSEGLRIASMLCNDCHLGNDGRLSGKFM